MTTVYISIGNSDDKLSQAEWAQFVKDMQRAVAQTGSYDGGQVHGEWFSSPSARWQNACWCLQLPGDPIAAEALKQWLATTAANYRQDSIAWAVAETEFIGPAS